MSWDSGHENNYKDHGTNKLQFTKLIKTKKKIVTAHVNLGLFYIEKMFN